MEQYDRHEVFGLILMLPQGRYLFRRVQVTLYLHVFGIDFDVFCVVLVYDIVLLSVIVNAIQHGSDV